MILLGHRGAPRAWPENTSAGLQAALDLGAEGVEFDVRLTRDGVPVLHHDTTLARLTGLPERIADLTWPEIAARTAGSPAPVAALADVRPHLLLRGWLDIEIKELGAERPTLDLLAGYPDLSRVALSSFNPAVLARSRLRHASLQRWLNANTLTEEALQVARDVGATAVIIPAAQLNPAAIQMAQTNNLQVGCWGIDRADQLDRLRSLGVAIAIADLPLRNE